MKEFSIKVVCYVSDVQEIRDLLAANYEIVEQSDFNVARQINDPEVSLGLVFRLRTLPPLPPEVETSGEARWEIEEAEEWNEEMLRRHFSEQFPAEFGISDP